MDISDFLTEQYGPSISGYLEPNELYALSQVSKTVGIQPKVAKFKQALEYVTSHIKELHLPLRTIAQRTNFTITELYEACEFLWNIGKIGITDITAIRMEVNENKLVINMITDMFTLLDEYNRLRPDLDHEEIVAILEPAALDLGYDPDILKESYFFDYEGDFIIWIIEQASYRFNPTIIQYLIDNYDEHVDKDLTSNYMLDPAIRAITIKRLGPDTIKEQERLYMTDLGLPSDIDGFGLVLDYGSLLATAIRFQDYDLFMAYFKKHVKHPDIEYINSLFLGSSSLITDELDETIRRSGGFI